MSTRTTALDARYGRTPQHRRRRRIGLVIAGALLAAAAAAWAVWSGVGGAAQALDPETTSVVLGDRAVTVRWTVTGRPSQALVCAIEAQDTSGVVVGLVEQRVPVTGSAVRSGTTRVRIVRAATTGLIDSCRPA